jgi:type I restriction enzyme, S subunit
MVRDSKPTLPPSWAWARLEDFADHCLGKMLDGKRQRGQPMPYLRNINVRWGAFDIEELLEMPFEKHEVERYGILDGDLLICEGGEPGRSAVWRLGPTHIKLQKALHRVRCQDGVVPEFLALQLQHLANGDGLSRYFTGTTIKHLPGVALRKIQFKIPPTREQLRIVARIEELFGEIEAGEQDLEKALEGLGAHRRAVLRAAINGDLTREWRERHTEQDAESLLAEALVERRAVARKNGHYREPSKPSQDMAELPHRWCWCLGEQLFLWSSGKNLPAADMRPGSYPVYGGNGIAGWHNEFNCAKPTVVIGRVGALCGNVHTTTGPAWITDNAIYASFVPSGTSLEYLSLVLSDKNLNKLSAGSGQPFVNQKILNETIFRLPPKREQQKIAAAAKENFDSIDAANKSVRDTISRSASLRKAVLTAAFSGELAPQDDTDEPASALVQRLKGASKGSGPGRTRRFATREDVRA